MSCIREILSILNQNRLNESSFVYNGSDYENHYGRYTKNRKPISREEYHDAMKSLLSQEDEEGTIEYNLNIPHKEFASGVHKLLNFISSLEYDEEYEVFKDIRGHLGRLDPYDELTRVNQIMEDTGLEEYQAEKINDIISEYTSTNNYSVFTEEDRELLNKFIDESPLYMPPPVYRGLGFKKRLGEEELVDYNTFLELEVGQVMTFRDYASFSSNPDIAVEFAYSRGGEYKVYIVNTKNLTGVSIDHLSSIDYNEDELLYKVEAKMIVQNKVVDGNTIYFHVEEIPLEEDTEDMEVEVPLEGSMFIEGKCSK